MAMRPMASGPMKQLDRRRSLVHQICNPFARILFLSLPMSSSPQVWIYGVELPRGSAVLMTLPASVKSTHVEVGVRKAIGSVACRITTFLRPPKILSRKRKTDEHLELEGCVGTATIATRCHSLIGSISPISGLHQSARSLSLVALSKCCISFEYRSWNDAGPRKRPLVILQFIKATTFAVVYSDGI